MFVDNVLTLDGDLKFYNQRPRPPRSADVAVSCPSPISGQHSAHPPGRSPLLIAITGFGTHGVYRRTGAGGGAAVMLTVALCFNIVWEVVTELRYPKHY